MKESTGTGGNGFPGEFTEEEIYEFFNTGILKDNSEYMKLRRTWRSMLIGIINY